ncbi:hypothetical protein [Bradyrhizobium sp.]|uniref:hypothetical protein n=1 Tax=Bradyrhizobium sp. TaxID=376 RepID=UPI0027356C5C|nr:hypothetical protein [Bradyrhizobium sp.]MDP3690405.1 hypothetical protein [Bradyrhizobium sp.]
MSFFSRHYERSEAIHRAASKEEWIASLARNDDPVDRLFDLWPRIAGITRPFAAFSPFSSSEPPQYCQRLLRDSKQLGDSFARIKGFRP